MSQQAKLTLRAPPHRSFITGWPGIPAGQGRPAAHIAGSIEVRLGGKGLKASWLRIELRKLESTASGENWGELIGRGPIDVWTADGTAEQDGEGNWDLLQTADFPFKITIPEGLPPTARLDKQSGISYEVVTSLCVKAKKGLLRKESISNVIQSTHPITLEKHELHSTWPVYSVPDDHEQMVNQIFARIYRRQTCYGPGDKVEARIILTSKNVSPVKIKAVSLSIKETITFRGGKRQSRMLGGATKTANQRAETLAVKSQSINAKIYKGDTKTYDLSLIIPKPHALMTIQTAKHIEVSYTMRVYVDSKQPIIIDHLPLTITTATRAQSAAIVPQIGYVPGLSGPVDPRQQQQEQQAYAEEIGRSQSADPEMSGLSRGSTQRTITAHTPSRSLSFASMGNSSNASTERAFPQTSGGLNRRDTVMTTASGPGLAGRGIPGQMFSWGQYGAAQSYSPFGEAQGPVRSRFAGPSSIYEGRELAPEENRALFHHSLSNHLGEVIEGQEVVPDVNYHRPRQSQLPISASSSSLGDHGTSPALSHNSEQETNPFSAAQASELEKERLYQRAREQAERNQRRAAAAMAAAPSNGHRSVSSPFPSPSPSPMPSSVNEKQALYERAKREADRYQSHLNNPYPRGAEAGQSGGSNGNAAAVAAATGALGSRSAASSTSRFESPPSQSRRGSEQGNSSLPPPSAYPSAEEEKRRLYEAAKNERDSYVAGSSGSQQPSGTNGTSSSVTRAPAATSGFPSADEEKRRFEAARRETEAYLHGSSQPAGGSSSSAAPPRVETVPSYSSGSAAPAAQSYPSAEDEKRRLFEKAKAEVEAGQRARETAAAAGSSSGAGVTGNRAVSSPAYPSAEEEKRRLYEQAKAEVDANQAMTSTSSIVPSSSTPSMQPPTAQDEKSQMKRYHEAQEAIIRQQRQQQQQQQQQQAASYASPAPIRPTASYAPDYAHSPSLPGQSLDTALASHQQRHPPVSMQNGSRWQQPAPLPPSSPPLDDSASVTSLPYRSPSTVAGKQPAPLSPPPTLPSFSFSSMGDALPYSEYQPQRASYMGASPLQPQPQQMNHNRGQSLGGAAPPPLPPKTPLQNRY